MTEKPASAGSETAEPVTTCPWRDYDPSQPEELRDPYPTLARARREAPVFYSAVIDRWVVTRHEDVLGVIRDVEHFSSRVAMPFPEPPEAVWHRLPTQNGRAVYPSALTPLVKDDPEHRRARRVIQAPFTPRALRGQVPMIREIANRLLSQHSGGGFDLVDGYAMPFSLEVISRVVGVPGSDVKIILRGIDAVFRLNGMMLTDGQEILATANRVADYWQYLMLMAEDRCRTPREDFASIIAQAEGEGGRPSPREVAEHMHSLISPGFETTAQAITHGLHALLEHRDQWHLLQNNRELLDPAVMEMLRFRTVAKFLFRQAIEDTPVGGVTIPAGAIVVLALASADRDERQYPRADQFDITRHAENVAFGKWKHYCAGAPLAKLELKLTLETLLDRFPEASVVGGQNLAWRRDIRIDALEALQIDLGSERLASATQRAHDLRRNRP